MGADISMAINLKGKRLIFTGQDYITVSKEAKRLKMSFQNLVTGLLWEYVMREARKEADKCHSLQK